MIAVDHLLTIISPIHGQHSIISLVAIINVLYEMKNAPLFNITVDIIFRILNRWWINYLIFGEETIEGEIEYCKGSSDSF